MDEPVTSNPGRSYSHTFPDGTWISIHVADGGGPKIPASGYSALQKDPLTDLPFALTMGEKNFIQGSVVNWPGIINVCQKLIPSGFTGPVLIDIESPFNADGSLDIEWDIDTLRNIALYCLSMRPEVMWSWYLPTREYWSQDAEWRANNLALKAVTEVSQALSPSCYDYYGVNPKRDHARYAAIVELAREMAAPGQQVLPYTSHRYHNSTELYGFKMIPADEHVQHLRNLVQAGADGVIAWGGDRSTFINAFAKQASGGWKYGGTLWDRVREAWWSENGVGSGGAAPTLEEIESYLFSRVYPEVHERVRTALL